MKNKITSQDWIPILIQLRVGKEKIWFSLIPVIILGELSPKLKYFTLICHYCILLYKKEEMAKRLVTHFLRNILTPLDETIVHFIGRL